MNFNAPLTVQMSAGDVFNGVISGGGISETYSNINHLIANGGTDNIINLSSDLNFFSNVTFTGTLQGFISDPLFFTGFTVSGNVPNVSNIIEQPWQAQLPTPSLGNASYQYDDDYQDYLNKIKIDLWCSSKLVADSS